MAIACHIVVEGNPAIIYASRKGHPEKVLPLLEPFLEKFWQERDLAGENRHTPECLVAQLVVRFGYEICEDDFSNLRVGLGFDPDVAFLYRVGMDQSLTVWMPGDGYCRAPEQGLEGCVLWEDSPELVVES